MSREKMNHIASTISRRFSSLAGEIPVISMSDLKAKMREGSVTLVDVREKDEIIETGSLKEGKTEALNIPLGSVFNGALSMSDDDFEGEFGYKKPTQDALVVFSCRSGVRSLKAAAAARELFGYKNVLNYQGSAREWFADKGIHVR